MEGLQDRLWRSEEALRRAELQCQGLRQQTAALEEARVQVGRVQQMCSPVGTAGRGMLPLHVM